MPSTSATLVEEKHTSVKQLIELGKDKGYLLFDEIYELLPEEIVAHPDELLHDGTVLLGAALVQLLDQLDGLLVVEVVLVWLRFRQCPRGRWRIG